MVFCASRQLVFTVFCVSCQLVFTVFCFSRQLVFTVFCVSRQLVFTVFCVSRQLVFTGVNTAVGCSELNGLGSKPWVFFCVSRQLVFTGINIAVAVVVCILLVLIPTAAVVGIRYWRKGAESMIWGTLLTVVVMVMALKTHIHT